MIIDCPCRDDLFCLFFGYRYTKSLGGHRRYTPAHTSVEEILGLQVILQRTNFQSLIHRYFQIDPIVTKATLKKGSDAVYCIIRPDIIYPWYSDVPVHILRKVAF